MFFWTGFTQVETFFLLKWCIKVVGLKESFDIIFCNLIYVFCRCVVGKSKSDKFVQVDQKKYGHVDEL